jgi:hypothetical protein
MQSEMRELIDAASNMRDAANRLWHAHNPEDGQETPLPVDEAQQQHSDAFLRLERAEYYAEKLLQLKVPNTENQHRRIKGYRELNQEEIDLMNDVKTKGIELGELIGKLKTTKDIDQRWVSSGATDLQTGLMALTRAIAQPEIF